MIENDHMSSHRFLIFSFFYHFSSLCLRTHERKGGQAGVYVTYEKMGDGKMGSKLEQILQHNSEFVHERHYEPYKAGNFLKETRYINLHGYTSFGIIAAIHGTAQW